MPCSNAAHGLESTHYALVAVRLWLWQLKGVDMNDDFQKTAEQVAAFQKIWTESMTQIMQTAFTMTPNSAPPEVLRQIRSGLFQALAQSWDEFMRSPQFLDGMRQCMETAVNFRKMTNDFMARVRNE